MSDIVDKIKKKHILRKILITFFAMWIIFELLLLLLATPLLKSQIQKIISKESKGVYFIDFKYISIEPFTLSIKITNFKLTADSAKYNTLKKTNTVRAALYEMSFDELKMGNLKFVRYLRKSIIEFEKIELNNPNISILALPNNSNERDKYDAVHKDLYASIRPYAKSLVVKQIHINEGYFNLQLNSKVNNIESVADKVNVKILNFNLDSAAYYSKSKLFYSDSLLFIVKKYKLKLNDGIHSVFAEQVTVSMTDSSIIVKNAHIFPDSALLKKRTNKTLYDIYAPRVSIKGADIQNAWFNKRINIESINFDSSVMKIISPYEKIDTLKKNKPVQDYKNIFPLIQGKLNLVEVSDFNFTNASFMYYKGSIRNKPSYHIAKMNFSLHNFLLDSTAYSKSKKILYADDFEIDVQNYVMKTLDGKHFIKVDDLFLSTKKKKIYAVNVKIYPVLNAKSTTAKIHMTLPVFMLSGADFIKAYNTGELDIREFTTQNIKVNITKTASSKKIHNANPNIIYDLVSGYLNKVTIDKFILFNGKLSYKEIHPNKKNAFLQGRVSLTLSDFLLDENTAKRSDRIFYASNFDLTLKEFAMKSAKDLHIINVGELRASTYKSYLEISNFEYKPNQDTLYIDLLKKYNKQTINNISVEKLSFKNINIKNAIFRKKLNISEIYLKKPIVKIRTYNNLIKDNVNDTSIIDNLILTTIIDSISNELNVENNILSEQIITNDSISSLRRVIVDVFSGKLNQISVNNFLVDDGYMDLTNLDSAANVKAYFKSNINAKMDLFYFNKDSLFGKKPIFAGKTKIILSDFNTLLLLKKHKIKINKITYENKDSSLTSEFIRVFPDTSIEQTNLAKHLMFFSPKIKLSGIDLENILNKNGVNLNKVYIQKPFISLVKNEDIKKEEKEEKENLTFSNLKNIKVNEIVIEEGRVELASVKETIENVYGKLKFNFFAKNFAIDTLIKQGRLPFTYNIANLTISDVNINLPDSTYSISLDSALYSFHNSNITIQNFKYSTRTKKNIYSYLKAKNKNSTTVFSLKFAKITDININKLILEKRLIIKTIDLSYPTLEIVKFIPKGKNSKFNLAGVEKDLKEKVSKVLNEVLISRINIENFQFIRRNNINNKKDFYLKGINAKISTFNINKYEEPSENKIFFASDISCNLYNYSYEFSDNRYLLNIKKIAFSTKKKTIDIDSITYLPLDDKYTYANKIGKQKSVLFLQNANVKVLNFDFAKYIDNKDIYAKTIKIDNANLYVFKDMKLEPDIKKRPVDPWLHLNKLKNNVYVSKIILANSRLEYEQNSKKSAKTGSVFLNNIDGTITNVTNDTTVLINNNILGMKLKAKLQGTSLLKVSFKFPLTDTTGSYSFAGSLATFELKDLNPFIENIYFVSVRDGIINKMTFFVDVNSVEAEGKMHLFYNKLNIKVIDETSSSSKGFFTFFANTVLPSSNPKRKLGKIRQGKIYTKKIAYKPVFNLWVKAIVSGASATVGFKSKEMKEHLKLRKRIQKLLKREQRNKAITNKKKMKELKKDVE